MEVLEQTIPLIGELIDISSLLSGIAFPAIEPLSSDTERLSPLPAIAFDFTPSKTSVAREHRDAALAALQELGHLKNRLSALEAQLLNAVCDSTDIESVALELDPWQRGIAQRSAVSEVAMTLSIPERTAEMITEHSKSLCKEHRKTLTALNNSEISWQHSLIIARECHTLRETKGYSEELVKEFESKLLQFAVNTSAARFAGKARRLREQLHPESLVTRNRQAISKRFLSVDPGKDGMSWLTLHIPTIAAEAIWVHCTRTAREQQRTRKTATPFLMGLPSDPPLDDDADGTENTGFAGLGAGNSGARDQSPVAVGSGFFAPNVAEANGRGVEVVAPEDFDAEDCDAKDYDAKVVTPEDFDAEVLARQLSSRELRTLTQLRADIATALLLGTPSPQAKEIRRTASGLNDYLVDNVKEDPDSEYLTQLEAISLGGVVAEPPLPQAQVIVTVPVLGLLGATDQPATLAGQGPLPLDVARKLLAEAGTFLRVLIDPITGSPIDSAPQRYRLRDKEKLLIRALAETCSFPNCDTPALDTETDHLKAFQHGGQSIMPNLQPLCKRHHLLKHFADDKDRTGTFRVQRFPERASFKLRGWKPQKTPDGGVAWISPSGEYHPPLKKMDNSPRFPKWMRAKVTEPRESAG